MVVIASRQHAKRSQAKTINRDEGDKGDNKGPRIIFCHFGQSESDPGCYKSDAFHHRVHRVSQGKSQFLGKSVISEKLECRMY